MGNHTLRTPNPPRASAGTPYDAKESKPMKSTTEFDADLLEALRNNELSTARCMVADAEAVLAAHDLSAETEALRTALSRSHLAGARARIAMSAGDYVAARAILVQAIERWPDVTLLRAMMTEVMLASGRAKDVRPVLTHLGRTVDPRIAALPAGEEKKDSLG